MEIYAYYLTQRPAGPGAMPKDGILDVLNYDKPIADGNINRIWAKVSYSRKLSKQEVSVYELTPVPEKKENKGQHKVVSVRDYGSWYTVVKNRNDNVAPYRVYRMLDKWHKRQIAKCADLASAVSVIYGQIMEGR